ncbi:sensor histidine kinase [Desulfosporosinus nitroreducens]|uniref:sensor histidine kinase n=1 Tax=Desulfosporosinus nitroreducens TaxID=2018668 RepID=UPI00207C31BB|nr:HAMP domain-containing sensor histidine kinase [Desulfosporosinus nitroreducens]MCO1602016.1 HAMP domain-containing histidine kinase [Desulfosporosinus nitroreducens]
MITIHKIDLAEIVKSNIIRLIICLGSPLAAYGMVFTAYGYLYNWSTIAAKAAVPVFLIALILTGNLQSTLWKVILGLVVSIVVYLAGYSLTYDLWISLAMAVPSFLMIMAFTGRYKTFEHFLIKSWFMIKGICLRSVGMELFVFNILSLLGGCIVFGVLDYYWPSYLIPTGVLSVISFLIINILLVRNKLNYLKEITGGIAEISKGNLDYRVTVKGEDEFKTLAQNINHMSEQLLHKIEDERRAERTKNELITNVSHDLKTPLTTIIGYLTLLHDKKYESQDILAEYVGKAYTKSLKLKKLIEDLFEYTKLSNGIIQANKLTIDLIALMEQQMGEISVLAKQNNLCFVKSFSHPSIMVNVDSDLIARVFENVFSNAIKYSYRDLPGEIVVTVTKETNHVHISVENQGNTIPTELLPLLFERFFRTDQSRNSRTSGSGLGLAIAKSIVDLHNGEIYAESEANKIRVCLVLF